MSPITDPIVIALAIAFGLALGWILITSLWHASRGFRKLTTKVACMVGHHKPSEIYVPAIGGRDVMRCLYCDTVVHEVQRTRGSLRRNN